MIKKVLLLLIFTTASLFAINFQTASKDDLMSIKGIGEKRAASIIKYRKTNKIKSAADLQNIPGIGKEVVNNAKNGIKNASPATKKAAKKSKTLTDTKKETSTKKPKVKKEVKKQKKQAGDKTKKAEKKSLKKIKEKKKVETK